MLKALIAKNKDLPPPLLLTQQQKTVSQKRVIVAAHSKDLTLSSNGNPMSLSHTESFLPWVLLQQ